VALVVLVVCRSCSSWAAPGAGAQGLSPIMVGEFSRSGSFLSTQPEGKKPTTI